MAVVRFTVNCQTKEGDRVFAVGCHKDLGAWDPEKSKVELQTTASAYPVWCTEWRPESPATIRGTELRFKFVVRNAGGHFFWEDSFPGNRSFEIAKDFSGCAEVTADWNRDGLLGAQMVADKAPATPAAAAPAAPASPAKAPAGLFAIFAPAAPATPAAPTTPTTPRVKMPLADISPAAAPVTPRIKVPSFLAAFTPTHTPQTSASGASPAPIVDADTPPIPGLERSPSAVEKSPATPRNEPEKRSESNRSAVTPFSPGESQSSSESFNAPGKDDDSCNASDKASRSTMTSAVPPELYEAEAAPSSPAPEADAGCSGGLRRISSGGLTRISSGASLLSTGATGVAQKVSTGATDIAKKVSSGAAGAATRATGAIRRMAGKVQLTEAVAEEQAARRSLEEKRAELAEALLSGPAAIAAAEAAVERAVADLQLREAEWAKARDAARKAFQAKFGIPMSDHGHDLPGHGGHGGHGHGHGDHDDVLHGAKHQLEHRWIEKTGFGVAERVVAHAADSLTERMAEYGTEYMIERGAEHLATQALEKASEGAASHMLIRVMGETMRMGEATAIHALKALRVLVPLIGMLFVGHLAQHDWHSFKAGKGRAKLFYLLAVIGDWIDIAVHVFVVYAGLVEGLNIAHVDHHYLHEVEAYGMKAAIFACLSVMCGEILSARAARALQAAKKAPRPAVVAVAEP